MHRFHASALFDLSRTRAEGLFLRFAYAWEILPHLESFILEIGPGLPEDFDRVSEFVWVARSAKIAPSARIEGPAIIGRETDVRHCAFVRQNALIGDGAVVGNSSEIKNAVLFDCAQAPHFNYIGDAVMGHKAHTGAGVVLSNVKLDYGTVFIRDAGEVFDTGLVKFGALIGDRAEIGCNSVLNPGTVVGRDSVVYPLSFVRGVVPASSIVKRDGSLVPKTNR